MDGQGASYSWYEELSTKPFVSVVYFAAFVQDENRFWAKLAKDSGAKAD